MSDIKPKKVASRIKLLKVTRYKGCPIYLRQVDDSIFMYDLVINSEIYSDYLIITPAEGKTKLTDKQVRGSAGLIFAAATTTIDMYYKQQQEKITSQSIEKEQPKRAVN